MLLRLRLATFENPVLLKELRIGLRERRLFVTQLLFLLLLLFITIGTVTTVISNDQPERLPEAGKYFFASLFWVQLVLLGIIAPGLTCGALSGERERHSLDMVLASRLSAAEIVAGKLGYAVFYVTLLLFSSLPIASVAFFLGGVSPGEAAQAYFELLFLGVLAALVGLFFSSRETRSNYATTQSYLVVSVLGCFMLPFYAAIRAIDVGQLSPGYALTPMEMAAVLIVYAIFFLFIKAAHRLNPQYANIRLMSVGFILVYLLFVGLGLRGLQEAQADLSWVDKGWPPICVALCIAHLAWVGMFCNDTELPSALERRAFTASIFSRRCFWLTFLAVGASAPALYFRFIGSPDGTLAISSGCGLLSLYILVFPLLARALQAILRSSNYAAVYFVLTSLCFTLPTLGLLGDDPGPFSGIYLSPILAFTSLSSESSTGTISVLGERYSLAACSALVYSLLALLAALVILARRRKEAPT